LQQFFMARFGRSLPVSAFGQTARSTIARDSITAMRSTWPGGGDGRAEDRLEDCPVLT